MTKFSGRTATARREVRPTSPITTTGPGVTAEGAKGYVRDPKSELFLLAVTNMVGEDTFYEKAADRDARFRSLVHQVADQDPTWLRSFIPWLRNTANMRTASVVAAAEYAAARAPGASHVIGDTLARADEPGELVGYWLQTHGGVNHLPFTFKKGLAQATRRLYTERAVMKYDGQRGGMRFADVLALAHPRPTDEAQRRLFFHLHAARRGNVADPARYRGEGEYETPAALAANTQLMEVPEDQRRTLIRSDEGKRLYGQARWDWERLSGWLPGGMDAEAWEFAIPRMGYMALLRNLRNFDDAGISHDARTRVMEKLGDPAEVLSSRQFPFRFFSAYDATKSVTWGVTLETALDLSVSNIPRLSGRTLVLVDVSSSMAAALSRKSTVPRSVVGALFGVATWKRCGEGDLVAFGSDSEAFPLRPGTSVLRAVESFRDRYSVGRYDNNVVGHGTEAYKALARHYDGHDRVVIFTDCQFFPHGASEQAVESKVPLLYCFNLAGYQVGGFEAGRPGRHELGGFSDSTFKLMQLVEQYQSGSWESLFAG